jgi:hypothetical protein
MGVAKPQLYSPLLSRHDEVRGGMDAPAIYQSHGGDDV